MNSLGLTVIVIVGVLVVFYALNYLFLVLRHRYFLNVNPDYDRELSPKKIELIEQISLRVSAYSKSIPRNRIYSFVYLGGFVPFVLGFGVGILSGAASNFITNVIKRTFHQSLEQQVIYSDVFGMTFISAVFAGIFFTAVIIIWSARRNPSFLDHLNFWCDWGAYSASRKSDERISENITHLVRIGGVKTGKTYSDAQISRKIFEITNPVWMLFAKFFLGLSVITFVLDCFYLKEFTSDRLISSPYFSLRSTQYAYTNVHSIRPICRLYSDDGKVRGAFDYYIDFNDRTKVSLLGSGNISTDEITVIEHVETQFTGNKNSLKLNVRNVSGQPTLDDCLRYAEKEYDKAIMPKLRSFMGI